MISIKNANTLSRCYQFWCLHMRVRVAASGRLGHFPDVKISKRPNVLPSIFIDGLGRSGRSGRLSPDSCWEGKCNVFFPVCRSYRKHVLNVRNVLNVCKPTKPPFFSCSKIERYPRYESLV